MPTSPTIFSPGRRLKEAFRFLLSQIELPDFDLRTNQMTIAFDVVAG